MTDTETAVNHRCTGTGTDTKVKCEETGRTYGPGSLAETKPNYCPYCGVSIEDEEHRVARRFSEVFCEETTMSTWRSCPGCGEGGIDVAE